MGTPRLRFCGVVLIAGITSLSATQAAAQTPPRPAAQGERAGRAPDYPVRPPAPPEQVARGQPTYRVLDATRFAYADYRQPPLRVGDEQGRLGELRRDVRGFRGVDPGQIPVLPPRSVDSV